MKDIVKVKGRQVIEDYINCGKIDDCSKCEANKQIDCADFICYCAFMREFTDIFRNKLEEAINTIL